MIRAVRNLLLTSIALLSFAASSAAQWMPSTGNPVCIGPAAGQNIAPDGEAGAYVVWQHSKGGTYHTYAQRMDAEGRRCWTEGGLDISTAEIMQIFPRVIADGRGGAIALWQTAGYGVCAQKLDGDGNLLWTGAGVTVDHRGKGRNPRCAPDLEGGAIFTWWEEVSAGNFDIYAQRVDSSGAILWGGDVPVCTDTGYQSYPVIGPDGEGGAIIAWEDYRTSGAGIYAQRVNADGAVLWALDGVAVCTAPESQIWEELDVNAEGEALMTWTDYRAHYDDRNIYAQKLDAGGVALWTPDGVCVCDAPGNQYRSRIIADGTGGAIICWESDLTGACAGIFAQSLGSGGAPRWAAGGIELACRRYGAWKSEIVSDGAEGAIITWVDCRRGDSEYDVAAQRIDPSGECLWEQGGHTVFVETGSEPVPKLALSTEGRAIVVWHDSREGAGGIYAMLAVPEAPQTADAGDAPPALRASVYPNPFNPSVSIQFELAEGARVLMEIFDPAGRRVKTLIEGRLEEGRHVRVWDGRGEEGSPLPSGVYFYRLTAEERVSAGKIVLLR